MQEQELTAWLSLSLGSGLPSRQLLGLLAHFPSPRALLEMPLKELQPNLVAPIKAVRAACRAQGVQGRVMQALKWQEQKDCHILSLDSPHYPGLLREIADPPVLLYVQGHAEALSLPQLAIVGSRKPSPGGREMARLLAGDLSKAGFSICSGLALGIDTESHQGALAVKGVSVAVLGSGLDRVYPRQNQVLARDLRERGALVSEYPLGAAAQAWHFPQRNRVISGLSRGVLVVEAAQKSGSLITAHCALEQGREVFAVPGSPFNPQSRGCHSLLKNGAALVESVRDIAEELGGFCTNADISAAALLTDRMTQLSQPARNLLGCLDANWASMDTLVLRSGLPVEQVLATLSELEIYRLIEAGPEGYSLSLRRA